STLALTIGHFRQRTKGMALIESAQRHPARVHYLLAPLPIQYFIHLTGDTHGGKDTRRRWATMKIVVIGGSGFIGSKLVPRLREKGHEAIAASPNSGVNTLTGEGLAEVLKGASVVVDVSNSPSWEDSAVLNFFETSTRNLLKYGAEAG